MQSVPTFYKETKFVVNGKETLMSKLKLKGSYYFSDEEEDYEEYAEQVVRVKWIKTVPADKAVREVGFFGNQNTVCRPRTEKWEYTVERLKAVWGI